MLFGRKGWMQEMVGEQKTRGFLWGAGTAIAVYFLWPAIREAARPMAKGMTRGAMVAGDRVRSAFARTREGVEDVIAEAEYERMRDGLEPDTGMIPDTVSD